MNLAETNLVIAGQSEKQFAEGGQMVGAVRELFSNLQMDKVVIDSKPFKGTLPGILEFTFSGSGPVAHATIFATTLKGVVNRQLEGDTENKGLYSITDLLDDQGDTISAYFGVGHVELRKGTNQPTAEEAWAKQQAFFDKKDAAKLANVSGNGGGSGGGIDMAQVKAMVNERADKDQEKKKVEDAAGLAAAKAFRKASKEDAEVRCADETARNLKARAEDAEASQMKFNFLSDALAMLAATTDQAAKQNAAESK